MNRTTADAIIHPTLDAYPRHSGGGAIAFAGPDDARSLTICQAATRRLARSSAENFIVASVLLPAAMRQPFYDIYSFCRTADDLADQSPTPEVARAGLTRYRQRVDQMFRGESRVDTTSLEGQIFTALAATVHQFKMTRAPFDDLLDAFERDQSQTRYESREELLDYCRCSANPVGRMVLQLAGCDTPNLTPASDAICTGLQLANFWQDVARDHAMGRIYLPRETMGRHGFDESLIEQALARQEATPARVRAAVAELCDWSRGFFELGLPLADGVPRWLATDIKLFAHGGLATLDAIAAIDFDVLRRRVVVGRGKRLLLVARGLVGRL